MTHKINKHSIENITLEQLEQIDIADCPISKWLCSEVEKVNDSPFELVRELELHPNRKAAKQLVHWIVEGSGNRKLLDELAAALGKEQEVFDAISRTSTKRSRKILARDWWQARKYRSNFKAFIWVETRETRPKQIFVEALTNGRYKHIGLPPEFLQKSPDEQKRTIQRIFFWYLKKFGGQCPNWGLVTGFWFVHSWNANDKYTIDGKLRESVKRPLIPARAGLTWKNRAVPAPCIVKTGEQEFIDQLLKTPELFGD